MSNCWSCGQDVNDLLRCPKCGADQGSQTRAINLNSLRPTPTPTPTPTTHAPLLSDSDDRAVAELPADCALLLVKRGPQAGSRFLLDSAQITVGRASDNEIFLDDASVSRKHALFQRSISPEHVVRFSVNDVGSLNGTYVNGNRIDSVQLEAGDEVQIGKFRLVFYPGVAR